MATDADIARLQVEVAELKRRVEGTEKDWKSLISLVIVIVHAIAHAVTTFMTHK